MGRATGSILWKPGTCAVSTNPLLLFTQIIVLVPESQWLPFLFITSKLHSNRWMYGGSFFPSHSYFWNLFSIHIPLIGNINFHFDLHRINIFSLIVMEHLLIKPVEGKSAMPKTRFCCLNHFLVTHHLEIWNCRSVGHTMKIDGWILMSSPSIFTWLKDTGYFSCLS